MALGIGLALLASLCFALGNIIEKLAVDRMSRFSLRDLRGAVATLATSKLWLAGAALSLVGLPMQILAYSRITISIVQSIGVAGVVVLLVIARLALHEHLEKRESIGFALALASLVLVLLSLSRTSDIAGTMSSPGAAVIIASCTLAVVMAVLATPALRNDTGGFVYGCVAGLLYGLSGVGAKGLATLIAQYGWPGWFRHGIASPYLYLFLGCWALGLGVFQAGIQRSRVGVVGSLSTVVSSTYVVVMGMIIFHEHFPADAPMRALRIAGLLGVLTGSVLVGWGGSTSNAVESRPVPARDAR
jgi:drug/metabolite transporter (DMT)-like permease